jgi:hypothetical protein
MRLGGVALFFFAPCALAATVVESLSVQPNPATLAGGTPPLVEISVTVKRAQTDRQTCDVVIEPGDGGRPLLLTFATGDKRKSLRYSYSKPGPYTVKAIAGSGCSGTRSATLEVRVPGDPAPAMAAVPAAAASASAVQPGACPGGWYVVPESVQGSRYSCQPNLPAAPLRCAAGTRYFAENGVIGCR